MERGRKEGKTTMQNGNIRKEGQLIACVCGCEKNRGKTIEKRKWPGRAYERGEKPENGTNKELKMKGNENVE